MNRLEVIAQSFRRVNYTPRGNQTEIVSKILEEFLDKKKQNVVLNSDTGSGKSVIAAVVAESIRYYKNPKLSSVILMHQNSLTKQYYDSFKHLNQQSFFQIKGASNYSCDYLKFKGADKKEAHGENCTFGELHELEREKFCSGCEFKEAKKLINITNNLITNYSYFFISKLWAGHLEERALHVFDEAHTLNDIFCEHCAVHISEERLDYYIKECRAELGSVADKEILFLEGMKLDIKNKAITENNYIQRLDLLHGIYVNLKDKFSNKITGLGPDLMKKMKYKKISRKYEGLGCKIDDLIKHKYEHVFDETQKGEITVKPVFIKDSMHLMLGEYNLFMSATITPEFISDTFGLKDVSFIEVPSTFPSSNRPVFFVGKTALNYSNMQEKETVDNIKKQVGYITSFHKDDKGLILTPSFKLSQTIIPSIKGVVFEHKPGEKLDELISKFKNHLGPAVLVSPSLFEGLDFSGELSRYQIIVKTPYASLGDKRIKYIADKYPQIYRTNTLFKILQGMGRSIRSEEDFAATYMLDKSTKTLFDSKMNLWKDRYEVKL